MKLQSLLLTLFVSQATFAASDLISRIPSEGLYVINQAQIKDCAPLYKVKHACGGYLMLDNGALNVNRYSPSIFEQFCNLDKKIQKSDKKKDTYVAHYIPIETSVSRKTRFDTTTNGSITKTVDAVFSFKGFRPMKTHEVAEVAIKGSQLTLSHKSLDSGKWYGAADKCSYKLASSHDATQNLKHLGYYDAEILIQQVEKKSQEAEDLISKGEFFE